MQKSLEAAVLNKVLLEILIAVIILPCTNETIQTALKNNNGDLENVILYQIALENNIDYYVTNDKQAIKKLKKGSLEVLNSKAVVKRLG